MNFESNIKDIKKLVSILTGKDSEVYVTYKGTALGVAKPWHIRCENREINSETHEGAAKELMLVLKDELYHKIVSMENHVGDLKKSLMSIGADKKSLETMRQN